MDKIGVRFAGDRYINVELDPEITLTAAKAAKMENK